MGASDRGPSVTWRSLGAARGLLAILIIGLAFRLIIAYVLLPGSGFGADRQSFIAWASDLAASGPGGFYGRVSFIDYTPGYLYVLWLIGILGNALGGIGDLIKLPAILADVAVAYLVHQLVVELGGSRRAALLGALLFVVNPVTWFDSSVWAQVDSFGLIFLLLGLRELWRNHPERAAILATVAAVIKPQLGILVPILVAVLVKRHLIDPFRAADRDAPAGRLGGGPIRIITSGLLALATAALLSAPFGLSIVDLLVQVGKTAGGYPYITVNAYNPWALIEQGGNGLAASGTWLPDIATSSATGTPVSILGIPALFVGTALLLAVIVLVGVVVARRDDRRTILVGLTVLAIAFFVVPTRVHERYLFPFFALAAILAATSFRWRLAYFALAVANFANLYAVLTTPFYNNPGIRDWLGSADAFRSQAGVTIAALVHLLVGLWALTELRRGAQVRLDAETEADALEQEPVLRAPVGPAPPAPAYAAPARQTLGSIAAMSEASGYPDEAWDRPAAPPGSEAIAGAWTPPGSVARKPSPDAPVDDPGLAADPSPGFVGRLINRRPRLPDRSRLLHGEGAGRLDKLDLLIMAVLLIGVLTLRLFRLSDPYEFHFDEVYHARTAMEFLQGWNYGIPHEIYEWTHPPLAKYAMAEGIAYLGDNKVTATADLGGSIKAVLVEPRWDDPSLPNDRAGDRFYVAGGDMVRVYDLQTRDLIATYAVPGAQALALDRTNHEVVIGTASGEIARIDTSGELDQLRTSNPPPAPDGTAPVPLADLKVGIDELWVSDDGTALVAGTSNSDAVAVDPSTGTVNGTFHVAGLADFADGGAADGLVVAPSAITDPAAEARTIANLTGTSETTIEARLRTIAKGTGDAQQAVLGVIPSTAASSIPTAISNGSLANFAVVPLGEVAVAGTDGVTFLDQTTAEKAFAIPTDAPATGLTDVLGITTPMLYVATANKEIAVLSIDDPSSGTLSVPALSTTFQMPGDVSKLTFDVATKMIHVLGRTPDGSADTVYVVEPHANATYADAQLPFTSVSWALDATHDYPSTDREALLVASANGTIATIDVGGDPFAWRFPGVILGALTALLIYLLCRILFKRRSIAVLAGLLVAADGMFFVQSRIAMNDVYVGFFIVAAYTLFAAIWTGWWKWRWAWVVALPVIGLLLGLALASKWVGLYAIAGVGILILGRSALGRIILILSMIGGTVYLGNTALTAIPVVHPTSGPNYLFVFVLVGLTLASVLYTVLRPVAWSDDETRLAIAGPALLGILVFLGSVGLGVATKPFAVHSISVEPIEIAAALIVGSGIVYLLFRLAGSFGVGPLSPAPDAGDPLSLAEPAAPPPAGWLRLGWGFGIPAVWIAATLLILPLVVYVVAYIPWAVSTAGELTPGAPQIIAGWPAGHTGQTLVQLTQAMYNYHNDLRTGHPASSPFWAWPFDFKPVWFYESSFAGNTSAAIYDNGNLVTWWLEIPAIAFVAWQAFKRSSLGLGLILIGFILQWVPWMPIDRATFQYHYYTSLPFLVIALAYFLAELWHGASRRTWLLARVSAALVVLGPGLLWAFKGPLCGYVRVNVANPGSGACVDSTPGDLLITVQAAALALVMVVAAILLIAQLVRLRQGGTDRQIARIVATAGGAVVAVLAVRALLPTTPLIDQAGFSTAPIAFAILAVLIPIAWVVLTARDARRFVAGVVSAATVFFIVFYPNIAALPMPSSVFNAYQGVLPTWLYPFQFPVNMDEAGTAAQPIIPTHLDPTSLIPLATGLMLVILCVVVGYSAWSARIPRGGSRPAGGDGA
jgi:hypothetical protein